MFFATSMFAPHHHQAYHVLLPIDTLPLPGARFRLATHVCWFHSTLGMARSDCALRLHACLLACLFTSPALLRVSSSGSSGKFALNQRSRKSHELKAFPHAAITFWWGALHRSVRFEGEVAMVSEEESDEYFSCRPTGSKVSLGTRRRDSNELVQATVASNVTDLAQRRCRLLPRMKRLEAFRSEVEPKPNES